MKQIMKFLCSLMIIALPVFGDGWNSTSTSQSTSSSYSTLDNVANKEGIHVVRIESGSPNTLKYQLLNSSGSLIRTTTIDNGVSNSPAIVSGNNSNLYAVYVKGTQIVIKQSNDVGQNWTTPSFNTKDFESGYTTSYGIDAAIDGNNVIHIVYSIKGSGTSSEVFYRNYDPSSGVWANFKNVTDQTSLDYGRDPSITLSSGKVQIACTKTEGTGGTLYSRDRVIADDSWETPIQVNPTNQNGYLSSIISDNENEYVLYVRSYGDMGTIMTPLMYSKRSINGSSWDAPTQLAGVVEYSYPPRIVKTVDGNIFAFYISSGNVYYRKYNNSNSTWESTTVLSTDILSEHNVTAYNVGNDIFVNWVAYSGTDNLLRYRQYDAAPTSPTAMSIGSSNQVTVNWAWNPEPDINNYEVWRKYWRSRFDNQDWTLMASPTTNGWTDPDFQLSSIGDHYTVYYKTRSKDKSNQLSGYSSEISTDAVMVFWKNGRLAEQVTPTQYNLEQNYPNPFNPTTTIDYSIPEASNVQITVFDHIGREVTSVVNKNQNAGYYSATFDASKLASGVYFYKISAGRFSSTKRMVLLK